MIKQEYIPYTVEEIKTMEETIENLQEENNAYKELAKMNEKHFKEMQNTIAQYRQPINELKDLWHPGDERPTRQINSNYVYYALCIYWYDGWNEELCKINKDGTFTDSNGNIWGLERDFFDYWCYTDDLIPDNLDK
ncbi:hypothetical protein J6O48_14090 [bacterium]|nr:hypothetical protein [bacterium]